MQAMVFFIEFLSEYLSLFLAELVFFLLFSFPAFLEKAGFAHFLLKLAEIIVFCKKTRGDLVNHNGSIVRGGQDMFAVRQKIGCIQGILVIDEGKDAIACGRFP